MVALSIGLLLILETSGWVALARSQVPPQLVERMAALNNGRFRLDDQSLEKVPERLRPGLRSELIRLRDINQDDYEARYPNETPADAPVPRLSVDSWVSTPVFGSFSAHIDEGSLGEGLSSRYAWAVLGWIRIPWLDGYWIT